MNDDAELIASLRALVYRPSDQNMTNVSALLQKAADRLEALTRDRADSCYIGSFSSSCSRGTHGCTKKHSE